MIYNETLGDSPFVNARFGAIAFGQQMGIWIGLSALTQITFGYFRYPLGVSVRACKTWAAKAPFVRKVIFTTMRYTVMAQYVYSVGFTNSGFVMVYNTKRVGWEFPGGSIEPGETKEEAAVREFLEETGRHLRVRGSVSYPDGGVVFIGQASDAVQDIVDPAIDRAAVFTKLPDSLAFPRKEYEGILKSAAEIMK